MNPIIKAVAAEFNVSYQDIKGKSRKAPLPDARKASSFFLNKYKAPNESLTNVGFHLNIRHDGMIYNLNKHYELFHVDKKYKQKIMNLNDYLHIIM